MKELKKMNVGIITYHSAYNFGSVLQALATQHVVRELGYDAKIINYRMKSQYDFYQIKRKKGLKAAIKRFLYGFRYNDMLEREFIFEDFIKNNFLLTNEFAEPQDAACVFQQFDTIISGSDQIWNKNSNELYSVDWEYMHPYLLHGYVGNKISYASSVVNMTEEQLGFLTPYLSDFFYISCREQDASDKVSKLINKDVETVCDPTILLSVDDWKEYFQSYSDIREDYILIYTLASFMRSNEIVSKIKRNYKNQRIIVISPISPIIKTLGVDIRYNVGPQEFLNLIYNAKCVITDSYHGTMFSINFHVNFYHIIEEGTREIRVRNVLDLLGLNERQVHKLEDVDISKAIDFECIDYSLDAFRNRSIQYLKKSLDACDGKK